MIFETRFLPANFPCWLVATDEAGRGPLAGPVVAAAVAMRVDGMAELAKLVNQLRSLGVTDSKKLSAKQRHELRERNWSGVSISWSEQSAEKIDSLNILAASLLAMKQAAEAAVADNKHWPVIWLIDGNKAPKDVNPLWNVYPIVAGDSHSALIGLASIVAKVERDQIMQQYHTMYPQYGFDQHAGYPTAQHRAAIASFGVSAIHRKTFKGVREYLTR